MDPPAGSKRAERPESLGWLTESGVMPKKQREIEGVGASSLVDLQAQLFRAQERAKQRQAGVPDPEEARKRSGFKVATLFERPNAGVSDRDRRDQQDLPTDKTADIYSALEKKAALYERIVRGEVLDDEEVYNVDFMRKGFLEEAPPPPPPPSSSGDGPAHPYGNLDGGMMSEDMQRERERQSWEAGVTAAHHAELEEEQRRQERKEAILDINKETRDERDRTHSLRHRRAAQAERNREKLKAAFLKQQVQKLKQQGAEQAQKLKQQGAEQMQKPKQQGAEQMQKLKQQGAASRKASDAHRDAP